MSVRALVARLALMLFVTAVALGATAGPASAHNSLIGTDPADGSTVVQAPDSVTLTFREPALALGTKILVTGPGGPVSSGAAKLVDNTVTQVLGGPAPPGRYTVSWRVTSADGHPIEGTFSFTTTAGVEIPTAAAPPAPSTEASDAPNRAWLWAVLALLVVSTATAFGRRLTSRRARD